MGLTPIIKESPLFKLDILSSPLKFSFARIPPSCQSLHIEYFIYIFLLEGVAQHSRHIIYQNRNLEESGCDTED